MKFWLTILIQLALAGIELLVKMLNRRLDAKAKAEKEKEKADGPNPYADVEPPADFREELLGQVKRLQETTKAFRKKPQP